MARLTQLLERLASESARHDNVDRREPRYAVQAPVSLGVFRAGLEAERATSLAGPAHGFRPIYQGWATDLSAHGIGLLVEQSLTPHTCLVASFEALTQEPLHVPVRVVYCKQLLPRTYRVGGAFFDPADATTSPAQRQDQPE